ncbi:MAG: DUF6273 domain-containing protein [Bacilli bacterium]|nr:DUF6273 domain-containing protein [Bacilli bacterium]
MKSVNSSIVLTLSVLLLVSCGGGASSSSSSEKSFAPSSTEPISSEETSSASSSSTQTTTPSGDLPGEKPIISEDGKTITYGLYPNKHINDASLISSLETSSAQIANGWFMYEGNFYAKETARLYNSESYQFDDGTQINEGELYWYTVEPIVWNVMKSESGVYSLMTASIVDAHDFYHGYSPRVSAENVVYANNYKESDVRNWLSSYFYELSFGMADDYFAGLEVDNSPSTTDSNDNKYSCENTNEKVYLPSYQEVASFAPSIIRAKTSDYARARGAWCNVRDSELSYNGSYWTRSPSSEFDYCAWNVNAGGYLSQYAVDGNSHSVRPCIQIKL